MELLAKELFEKEHGNATTTKLRTHEKKIAILCRAKHETNLLQTRKWGLQPKVLDNEGSTLPPYLEANNPPSILFLTSVWLTSPTQNWQRGFEMASLETLPKKLGHVRILLHWNGPNLHDLNLAHSPILQTCSQQKTPHKSSRSCHHMNLLDFGGPWWPPKGPRFTRLFIASNWCSCISASRWSAAEKPWTTRYLCWAELGRMDQMVQKWRIQQQKIVILDGTTVGHLKSITGFGMSLGYLSVIATLKQTQWRSQNFRWQRHPESLVACIGTVPALRCSCTSWWSMIFMSMVRWGEVVLDKLLFPAVRIGALRILKPCHSISKQPSINIKTIKHHAIPWTFQSISKVRKPYAFYYCTFE